MKQGKKNINAATLQTEPSSLPAKQKYFDFICVLVLLALGTYHSVLYFGHQAVPNSDWPCFIETGKVVLSLKIPVDYKRAPVLGIMQIAISKLMPGPYPELTAGWLLNAVLHPLSLVLLWLIAKKIAGQAAVWFALVAGMNPYVISMIREPIVETTFLFFVLFTSYLIIIRSRWSYLPAAVTSMLRYEGAILIFMAFIVDLSLDRSKRNIVFAFLRSSTACIPLGLWMLGTVLNWNTQAGTHYLKEMGAESGGKIVWREYIELLWQSGFSNLFTPATQNAENAQKIYGLGKAMVLTGFIWGSFHGIVRKNLDIILFLILLAPYIFIHAWHGAIISRFCVPVNWIVLLITIYGWLVLCTFVNNKNQIPSAVIILLESVLLIIALVWTVMLAGHLSAIKQFSERSASIPFVTTAALMVLILTAIFTQRPRRIFKNIVIFILLVLFVVSNQFVIAQVIGNGQQEVEFKYLAEWYLKNAQPGEKMVTSMAGVAGIFAPDFKDMFIHTGSMNAQNPNDFIQECYEKGIKYVVWDSRLGNRPNDRYYKLWKLDNIAMLNQPRDIAQYKYLTSLHGMPGHYVNVFKLK